MEDTLRVKGFIQEDVKEVLILVLMEDTLRVATGVPSISIVRVLILVLMEDTLREDRKLGGCR